jgi:RecA/RadA recombinase
VFYCKDKNEAFSGRMYLISHFIVNFQHKTMNSFKTLDWACPTPPNYEKQKVHFRCPKMDQTLGPAFRPGNIIEIFGEAGSAKSQFCLDLALQTTAHSANGRVLFINTDRSFPARRMTQLLEHTDLSSDHLDRIVTYSAWESKSLFEALEKKIPGMY